MREKEEMKLSDSFDYKRLIRFTIPSIVMMVFTSIYGVVDGLFVSNYAGKTEFAALNLIMPVVMVFGAVGFMIGTGGSALVAKTLGEGDRERANRYFSMLIVMDLVAGVLLAVVGIVFLEPLAILLKADAEMLPYCLTYGRIVLAFQPAFMLQNAFQSLLITAEKPRFGLIVTVCAGCTNMVLDLIVVGLIPMGVAGAALATGISQCVGGLIPLFFFMRENDSLLRLCKTKFEVRPMLKVCANGSSELMSNISMSVVGMLYNLQLMNYAGQDGVAAYGVIMYVNFVFASSFIGYSIGVAPIIGYHYGAGNTDELKSLRKKSIVIVFASGVLMTVLAELLAYPLTKIFVGYDDNLFALTCKGFMIFSLVFMICGFNIFGSAFFTALNNGLVSAIISFLRTLVFQVAALFILPLLFEVDGIFASVLVSDLMASILTAAFLAANRKKYNY